MLAALVLCLAFHSELTLGSACNKTLVVLGDQLTGCPVLCLNWTLLPVNTRSNRHFLAPNCSISQMVGLKVFSNLVAMDLSGNGLAELPGDFSQSFPTLTRLDLRWNPLERLPPAMVNITNVTCYCPLARSILKDCEEAPSCGQSRCYPDSGNSTSIERFYQGSCRDRLLLAIYIGVPLALVALLLLGLGAVFLVRSKRASIQASTPGSKRPESVSNADASPQRYVSSESWKEGATGSPPASPGDYENVLIGQMSGKEYRRQVTADDTYYLESDAPASDDYLNDQPVYQNFAGPPTTPEDDVYIIPDK